MNFFLLTWTGQHYYFFATLRNSSFRMHPSFSSMDSLDINLTFISGLTSAAVDLNAVYKSAVAANAVLSSAKRNSFDQSLLEMIAIDFQPLSIVEDCGFQRLISKLQPSYRLPTRQTLFENQVPNWIFFIAKLTLLKSFNGPPLGHWSWKRSIQWPQQYIRNQIYLTNQPLKDLHSRSFLCHAR